MADLVGDHIDKQLGNYRLLRLLRQESATDVYLGEHIFLKTQATIKVLHAQIEQEVLETFLAETRNIARLKHPNILRVLEFGVEDKIPFLVTDYTTRGSLRQLYPRGMCVPLANVASYVKQVAAALQYIHDQGLSHCGVRPEHMLLGHQNRILLSDFNLSIDALDQRDPRKQDERDEELAYMAPEQLQGHPGPASDQYALAVAVYEWLSGELPFQVFSGEQAGRKLTPTSLDTKLPAIPPELTQVLMIALDQEPEQRFSSVAAFARAFEQISGPPQPLSSTTQNGASEITTGPQVRVQPLTTGVKAPKKRGFTLGIAISLFLFILVLAGGIVGYNVGLFSPIRQTIPTMTAIQAAKTVAARATQQAVATFTARSTQEIYATATSGSPFINDPLNDKSASTWQDIQAKTYGCTFSGGAYHMHVPNANTYLACGEQKNVFHNFAFEVEMSVIKGDGGGIVFRSDSDHTHFYVLRLITGGSQSFLDVAAYSSAKGQTTIQDIRDTISSTNGHTFNLLTAIAYEHSFYFYLNKQFLMTFQDATRNDGIMGLYVLNNNNPATEVVFRNAKIWKL
ncbi:serine/threonine protein kinase [Dictyobacter kobayashii]|uniref:non-specific serine/threonine protein kinase n=1 Tax=Dictyobacter kobayashii TaxID=2014872 RepID=A0A402AT40_9CHLR|nr:serine/threonine-protein kinase [Dictyobacter kobayashii]GCE22296.1 hypothetical protein KDK_60960 [Dictyobacter kobayashii]